jgi:hypothetical protein
VSSTVGTCARADVPIATRPATTPVSRIAFVRWGQVSISSFRRIGDTFHRSMRWNAPPMREKDEIGI